MLNENKFNRFIFFIFFSHLHCRLNFIFQKGGKFFWDHFHKFFEVKIMSSTSLLKLRAWAHTYMRCVTDAKFFFFLSLYLVSAPRSLANCHSDLSLSPLVRHVFSLYFRVCVWIFIYFCYLLHILCMCVWFPCLPNTEAKMLVFNRSLKYVWQTHEHTSLPSPKPTFGFDLCLQQQQLNKR